MKVIDPKDKDKQRAFRKNNPDKIKGYKLKDRFGITLEDFKKMKLSQNNKCAICSKEETALDKRAGRIKELAVDHCHKTGKIRSLLCGNCNQALGKIKENFDVALKIAKYIQEHTGVV